MIEKNKIKSLFCLFIHPNYDITITDCDINKLSLYLSNKYNCHLLVIYFNKYNNNYNDNIKIYIKNDILTYIYVNNASTEYNVQKFTLKYIFNSIMNVKESMLLSYEEINDLK